jgi:peptidoglycan/xylan/chitin deacetylase (PgdA/CDA1 family)
MRVKHRIIAIVILLAAALLSGILGMVAYRDEIVRAADSITYVINENGMGKRDSEQDKMKIALTFDDGPHPYYTEQLLKGLRERDVRVTFFVTGENVEAYPEVIQEMYEDGHLIGNHTYSHIQLTSGNREKFKEELIRTNEAIQEITGEAVMYVRPPYGSWDKEFEKELSMFPVLWTIDPLDWCSKDASGIAGTVCAKARENAIILMHDQYQSSVTAALSVVDTLTERGYEFVTVDEIMFD